MFVLLLGSVLFGVDFEYINVVDQVWCEVDRDA